MDVQGAVWGIAEGQSGEISETTVSLIAEAARLADQLGTEASAVVFGDCDDDLVRALGSRGAARIFVVPSGAAPLRDVDTCVAVLADLVRRHQPGVVLYGTTVLTRELAPRLAARLGTGLASDCTGLSVGPDGLVRMSRAAYGGRASCTVVCLRARPQMATLELQSSTATRGTPGREPQVVHIEGPLAATASRIAVEGLVQGDPRTMDLAEADVVVAGGAGVGSREGFELLVELASLLGGTVAASRVAVDAGWVPRDRQVGQSGRTVAPSLYVACGISGASHHTVGMRDAKTIVAINTDRTAPIFDLADLAIVGDVREVLHLVVDRLRDTRAKVPSPGDPTLDMSTRL